MPPRRSRPRPCNDAVFTPARLCGSYANPIHERKERTSILSKPVPSSIRDLVVASHPKKAARLIMGATWKDAHRLIFEHPQPDRVMSYLPVEDAYRLIKQIGETDAVELFELATDEQVQGVFDFECWDKDRFNDKSAVHWFRVMNAVSDEVFESRIRELDFQFVVLFFKRRMAVERFDEIWDGDLPSDPKHYMPPDRRHLITYLGKPDEIGLTHEVTQRIFRLDHDMYYRIIEAVYWESPTELEEWTYQDRAGRMADRGFPEYFSAIEIFSPVNPDLFKPAAKAAMTGMADGDDAEASRTRYLQRYEHQDTFLHRMLARDFPGRDEAVIEVAGIVNMVSVGERISFADAEALRRVVVSVDGYLNIGLEHVTGGDEGEAVRTLSSVRLADVYRIGRGLVRRLGERARALLPKATADGNGLRFLLIDPPHRDFIEALLKAEPKLAVAENASEPFTTAAQVAQTSERLRLWERMSELMHDVCGFTPEAIAAIPMLGLNHDNALALTYRTLFSTSYANDRLGRPFTPAPLKADDVAPLRERFDFDGAPRLGDAAVIEFRQWLAARDAAELWPLFEDIFTVLAQELDLTRASRRPDVRYVSSLLLELPY